ncbi:hypothetical protein F4802DRAFT_619154 [Xylaria palmicola]|nr:hypothetical protein F4802DRAFT_619154 [Xylaria palmicola]
MDSLSQVELAQRAAHNVAEVARNMQAKMRGSLFNPFFTQQDLIKNLATLSVSLSSVSLGQDKDEQEENEAIVSQEPFLGVLEKICTFHESHSVKQRSAHFPTLDALCAADFSQAVQSAIDLETIRKVEKGLKAFASASPYVTTNIFNVLRIFAKHEGQAKKHAERKRRDINKTRPNEDESYPRYVYDTLYDVVKKYRECRCGPAKSSLGPTEGHWGGLELKTKFRASGNDVLFHTVFSKKGFIKRSEKIKWQHLQFRVPRKLRKARVAGCESKKCDDPIEDSAILDDAVDSTVTSASEFCKLLGTDIGPASIDVRISDEALLVLKRAVDIDIDIDDQRSISLDDMLINELLVPKSKLLVAYILAKSIWQFYHSDFISVRWTTETIQFFREEGEEGDEGEPSVDWTPYYAFSFDRISERDSMERLPPGKLLHRYPRVLELGAILYELGRKRLPGGQRKSPTPKSPINHLEPPTLEKRINTAASTVRRGVRKREWPAIGLRDVGALEDYRMIVANCVSENLFRPDPQEESQSNSTQSLQKTSEELEEELTVEERRAILFKKVVEPLKQVLYSAGLVDESGNIRPHDVKGATASRIEKGPGLQKPRLGALLSDTPQMYQTLTNRTRDNPTAPGRAKAEVWLSKIKESDVTEHVFSAFRRKELAGRRIRIAILDTGYDPDAVFFDRNRKRHLQGWKDYVEKDQQLPKDEDGHGTHVLSVLMKVAPAADVFVARVTRDTPDLQNATRNIAQAIEWAWKDCKADIINMSFGFDEEIYVDGTRIVSNAILTALLETNQRILFFAAAANDGGNRNEMFPASNMNVLSIRGTDDYGWAQRFNPPPDYNSATCFMTLGLDVPGASLTTSEHEGADVCKSGTSVATPIAAGIAAMLLGYALIHEEDLQKLLGPRRMKLAKLWSRTGISALFEKMATEMSEKWSYIGVHKFTELPHEMRLSMMAHAVMEAKG